MILYLTGMTGAGKTTLAKEIASTFNMKFADIDQLIEIQEGMSIQQIFEEHGEETFRLLEKKMLAKCSEAGNIVIATGGGLIMNESNFTFMKSKGITICIMRPAEEIWNNIDLGNRPLLQTKGVDNFINLYNSRLPVYQERCDIFLNDSWDNLRKKLLEYVSNNLFQDEKI